MKNKTIQDFFKAVLRKAFGLYSAGELPRAGANTPFPDGLFSLEQELSIFLLAFVGLAVRAGFTSSEVSALFSAVLPQGPALIAALDQRVSGYSRMPVQGAFQGTLAELLCAVVPGAPLANLGGRALACDLSVFHAELSRAYTSRVGPLPEPALFTAAVESAFGYVVERQGSRKRELLFSLPPDVAGTVVSSRAARAAFDRAPGGFRFAYETINAGTWGTTRLGRELRLTLVQGTLQALSDDGSPRPLVHLERVVLRDLPQRFPEVAANVKALTGLSPDRL